MAAEKIAWDGAPSQVIFMCPAIPLRGALPDTKAAKRRQNPQCGIISTKNAAVPAAFVEIHFAACSDKPHRQAFRGVLDAA